MSVLGWIILVIVGLGLSIYSGIKEWSNLKLYGIMIPFAIICYIFFSSDGSNHFVGTYKAVDAAGTKFTFILSEDGTAKCIEEWKSIYAIANSYSKNNEFGDCRQTDTETHYGYWEVISNVQAEIVIIEDGPFINFSSNDGDNGIYYQIKDGYLYTSGPDCKASNPKRRIKITNQE